MKQSLPELALKFPAAVVACTKSRQSTFPHGRGRGIQFPQQAEKLLRADGCWGKGVIPVRVAIAVDGSTAMHTCSS